MRRGDTAAQMAKLDPHLMRQPFCAPDEEDMIVVTPSTGHDRYRGRVPVQPKPAAPPIGHPSRANHEHDLAGRSRQDRPAPAHPPTGRFANDVHRDRDSRARRGGIADRDERSAWHWLLWLPVMLPLITPVYNRIEPRWFGIPFFYWFQLAFVGLDITVITLVYQATKRRTLP